MNEHRTSELLLRWLCSGQTGCAFAKRFAGRNLNLRHILTVSIVDEPDGDAVFATNSWLEQAYIQEKVAIVAFPMLRTQAEVAQLLVSLCSQEDGRWGMKELEWKEGTRRMGVLVGLNWKTPNDYTSIVLGLAPFGSMPITRRSPVVALALWPGSFDNPYRKQRLREIVDLGDMRIDEDLEEEPYNRMMNATLRDKASILQDQAEGASRTDVTFCLDDSAREILAPYLGGDAHPESLTTTPRP